MVSNVHYIELIINGELIELEAQDSLNLRINNVLFNPTKTSTTQAEYSYSFDIPSTPKNDKILNYANNLSRINKFHARYPAQVYADGHLIFDGSLTVRKYDSKDKMYECNLVNIKINTLDEIFGDSKLTDLKWEVPFNGASTINSVNSDYSTKYYFPLVSYGVFKKDYVTKDEVSATYTPKHHLDKYNKWFVESFYPSINMMEYIKKAFEWKGYNVAGTAFSDPYISNIYASCNLASEQVPKYNLGNPLMGKVELNCHWSNGTDKDHCYKGSNQGLNFPYFPLGFQGSSHSSRSRGPNTDYCELDSVDIWSVWDSANTYSSVEILNDSYMWDKNDRCIVIPADGFYKIEMNIVGNVEQGDGGLKYDKYAYYSSGVDVYKGTPQTATPLSLKDSAAFEVQLVRNLKTSDNLELIFGKKKKVWWANSEVAPYTTEVISCFPHEDSASSEITTKMGDLKSTTSRYGGNSSYSTNGTFGNGSTMSGGGTSTTGGRNFGGTRSGGSTATRGGGFIRNRNYSTFLGYVYKDNQMMAYDPVVNDNFICGFSTFSDGVASVRKNGYSWSDLYSDRTDNFYFCPPYNARTYKMEDGTETTIEESTEAFNLNTYTYSPDNTCWATDENMYGNLSCCIWLNKDDVLQLAMILRHYYSNTSPSTAQPNYYISADIHFTIQAFSEEPYAKLKAMPITYRTPVMFSDKLNLCNFTNKEVKISEWINNVQKAFNLEIVQDGNNIDINTNQGIKKNITNAIDIDYRVSNNESESEFISYPKEMSVKYKIDTDEWGFELTVPPEHINDEGDEWKNWGDSGFTVIQLNDDTYETSTQNTQTNFSYTYYDNFLWKDVLEDGTERDYTGLTISIPVIEKAEFMAEGYGYDEAMKHDGYSLTQRFWYRDQVSQEYVWLSNYQHEQVFLTYPMNMWDGFNLSYKDNEKSIATEYFNIYPMLSSNYVKVDVYLSPDEYKQIKGGALVHFDSDLYYTAEISGYDPSGGNPTTLKLIKKV